jgi:hypothetical protein
MPSFPGLKRGSGTSANVPVVWLLQLRNIQERMSQSHTSASQRGKGNVPNMKSIKQIKAEILKEIEAEKKMAKPELSEEPFLKAEAAYKELAETDVTKESIVSTVNHVRSFLHHLFGVLTDETLLTLEKTERENKENEKKLEAWKILSRRTPWSSCGRTWRRASRSQKTSSARK